jgi:methyl-accepting chemotaxis protein
MDNQCEFGKWLYGLDVIEKAHPRAIRIKALHADFHREAGRVLAMALAGKKKDAEATLAPTSAFAKTSGALALELNGWMGEL